MILGLVKYCNVVEQASDRSAVEGDGGGKRQGHWKSLQGVPRYFLRSSCARKGGDTRPRFVLSWKQKTLWAAQGSWDQLAPGWWL